MDEETINICHLLDSVVRMLDARAFSDDITLKAEYEEDVPEMYVDQRLIRQVFINIIGNALKFSKSGDVITIKVYVSKSGEVEVRIEDQGVGIAEDKIEQALEPFGQISDQEESQPDQGTGLGLPLAKGMMDLHGGSLNIESSLGQGTAVILSFRKSGLYMILNRTLPRRCKSRIFCCIIKNVEQKDV